MIHYIYIQIWASESSEKHNWHNYLVKCVKERRRSRRIRLPSSSLKTIPTNKFKKGDPYDTCAICLEDYVDGDKLRILPCSHGWIAFF